MRISTVLSFVLIALSPLPAQGETADGEYAADVGTLRKWLSDYTSGAIRIASKGQLITRETDRARKVLFGVARHDNLPGAKLLFQIATLNLEPPGTSTSASDKAAFYDEIRLFFVRTLAREAIAGMAGEEVEDWLLRTARSKAGGEFKDAASNAGAALRILAGRDSDKAKESLLRGARSFKPEVRVQAVNAMSMAATLSLVPHFFELLRDKEPYIRIACINGLGRALKAHTDETIHQTITPEVASLRDQAIKHMGKLLLRDRVWQVRAAARENLAMLKSKLVIPVLIAGLDAELRRKKDPWSLDIRLHQALEGLTGLKMPRGQASTWQQFWRKEGATFKFAPAGKKAGDEGAKNSRYDKFFNLELFSNRVMFIVDFSGSMIENITLKTKGVGTAGGGGSRMTTKAKLVVDELKKMVMTLKDGDLFNIIVFGDDVRIWKTAKDGKPALMKMNDGLRDELLGGYLDNLHPAGMTNLYGALEVALGLGGRGLHDNYYSAGYDTLYVLSDGAPTAGKITDTAEILRVVREANALKKISINTITFGQLNQLRFLKKLAEENGGRHVHIE